MIRGELHVMPDSGSAFSKDCIVSQSPQCENITNKFAASQMSMPDEQVELHDSTFSHDSFEKFESEECGLRKIRGELRAMSDSGAAFSQACVLSQSPQCETIRSKFMTSQMGTSDKQVAL